MTNRPTTTVTMFAAAEGDNEYTKLLAENAKLRAENARLRWHRDLLRSVVASVLEVFLREVKRHGDLSLAFGHPLLIEQGPSVKSAVAAMIETDPERDAEEHKQVATEVAALCAAEAFRGAQEECHRLRTRLAEAEAEAAAMRKAIEVLLKGAKGEPGVHYLFLVWANAIDGLKKSIESNAGSELLERLRAAEEKAKSWDGFVASIASCRAGGRRPQADQEGKAET